MENEAEFHQNVSRCEFVSLVFLKADVNTRLSNTQIKIFLHEHYITFKLKILQI